MEYLLEALHVTKIFGTLKANDDVTLKVKPGEIHAFLGENGAGKSTLVKMIYGALQPTSGEFRWMGKPVDIASPAAARKLGIGMVFQHFSLFEALTVAENIALAMPGAFDMKKLSERITRVSRDYGLPLEPFAVVADLSVGERQRIEIVRCLLQEPKLLIMDEPTAVLTPQEADQLFLTLARLAREGCAVIYIQPSPRGGEAPLPQRHHPAPWQGGRQCRPHGRNRGEPGAPHGGRRHSRGEPAGRRDGTCQTDQHPPHASTI